MDLNFVANFCLVFLGTWLLATFSDEEAVKLVPTSFFAVCVIHELAVCLVEPTMLFLSSVYSYTMTSIITSGIHCCCYLCLCMYCVHHYRQWHAQCLLTLAVFILCTLKPFDLFVMANINTWKSHAWKTRTNSTAVWLLERYCYICASTACMGTAHAVNRRLPGCYARPDPPPPVKQLNWQYLYALGVGLFVCLYCWLAVVGTFAFLNAQLTKGGTYLLRNVRLRRQPANQVAAPLHSPRLVVQNDDQAANAANDTQLLLPAPNVSKKTEKQERKQGQQKQRTKAADYWQKDTVATVTQAQALNDNKSDTSADEGSEDQDGAQAPAEGPQGDGSGTRTKRMRNDKEGESTGVSKKSRGGAGSDSSA